MKCAKCHNSDTAVIDSRITDDGCAIRRRRECAKCGYRFTTFERARTLEIMVKKRDGSHEPYDRAKIEKAIWIACGKRPVEKKAVDILITDIENELSGETEVTSRRIGKLVLERIKDLDEVAYIRYASVYKKFKDIDTFKDELGKLLDDENSK